MVAKQAERFNDSLFDGNNLFDGNRQMGYIRNKFKLNVLNENLELLKRKWKHVEVGGCIL